MKNKIIGIICISLCLIALVFGLKQGGYRDSYGRASVICMECIGLGD